jgi:hypothetical protein
MCCFQELAEFEKMPDEAKIDANGQYNLRIFKTHVDCKMHRN